jgi:multicomponent Na+:H+ antiporter subunit D
MQTMTDNAVLLGPIVAPFAGALLTLILWGRNRLQRWVMVATALAALGFTLLLSGQAIADGVQIYRLGGWVPPYGITLAADGVTAFFLTAAALVGFAVTLYTFGCKDKAMKRSAYAPIALMQSAALNGAFLTGDIFTFFVFMELLVISSVILVAMSDNQDGIEAATKYLLISAIGSLFLLVGIGTSYAVFGTLNMADIARQSAEGGTLAGVALLMLMCAFLLKSAAFPFHFWQPDFHTTAPTPMSALLSSVVVKIGVYGLIRLTTLLFPVQAPTVQPALILLGLIGVFFGGLTALRTYNVKRVLAYSTLAQIGFILIAIGWGGEAALAAALLYSFSHALIKSSLLMLAGWLASQTVVKTSAIKQSHGLGQKMPLAGALFFVGGLALSGIPPLNGFISKLALVQGGVAAAQSQADQWVALGLVVGGGILTLLYMVRLWQTLFQQAPNDLTAELKPAGEGDSIFAPAFSIGLCIALGLFAQPVVAVAQQVAAGLSSSAPYITGVLGG